MEKRWLLPVILLTGLIATTFFVSKNEHAAFTVDNGKIGFQFSLPDWNNIAPITAIAQLFTKIDPGQAACGLNLDDVFTIEEKYTLKWKCGGDEAPCTIYANGKIFSQVVGSGALQLRIKEPAIVYIIRNRRNQSCDFKIAHRLQTPPKDIVISSASSPLTTVTYTNETDFETAVIAHTLLYDDLTIATTTILTNDTNASSSIRTAVANIISYTSDGSLSGAEETTLAANSTSMVNVGTGLEITKVTVASSSESFLWMRETDSTKDTGVNAIFRINGYKTITGGGSSQYLLLGSPHWDDDAYTLLFPLREFVRSKNARGILIGTTDKFKLNPTGTGADSNVSDDAASLGGGTALCTGMTGPGIMVTNDKGIYYIENIAGTDDAIYFIPYGTSCPSTLILQDNALPNTFDNPRSLAFVGSARRIIAADRGGEQFWCQDLASDGTASGSPVLSDFTDATFEADSIAVSPNGLIMYVVDDPDLNVNTTDNRLLSFNIDSSCNVTGFTVIASSRGEIDSIAFDAFGNLIFLEDNTADDKSDIKYINSAQGGGTTISTLILGDSVSLVEGITVAGHVLDDITTNALAISSSDRGIGSGNLFISDDTGDEIYTIVLTRDSDGLITGFERTLLTDFAATTNTVEGLAINESNQNLLILQENSSDSGSVFQATLYNDIVIDSGNLTDVSRIIGYQTILEEFAEDLNTIHWQWHGYRQSDWNPTLCNGVYPVTVSDGSTTTSKQATFTYLEDIMSDYFTGWEGCNSDFWEIFPSQAQVTLGAQTNKQGEFIQTLNSTIGIDTNDIFMQVEMGENIRAGDLETLDTDADRRFRDAHSAF